MKMNTNLRPLLKSSQWFCMFLIMLLGLTDLQAGCNFGMTSKTHVANSYTFTIGQGPWGARHYTWQFGDGSTGNSYSNSSNTSSITHTFSGTGVFTMTITAQDSVGGGCISWINDTVTVSPPTGCHAQFTYWVDSTTNCSVHLINQSTGGSSPTYDWVYYDGGYNYITNQANPVITFSTTGASHYISLSQNDSGSLCDSVNSQIYMPLVCGGTPPPPTCHAYFNSAHTTAHCHQFYNVSPAFTSCVWSFGDGTTSTLTNPVHCYSDSLSYHNVTLLINNSACSDSTSHPVIDSNIVGNTLCHAQFTYWVDSSNCAVHIVNQSTGGTSPTYDWGYYDGAYMSITNLLNPVITFSTTGNHYVILYQNDSGAFCDSVSVQINMPLACGGTPPPPSCHAYFSSVHTTLHCWQFYNASPVFTSCVWSFGDGTTSTLPSPIHCYSDSLTYHNVTLFITNGSCSDSISHPVIDSNIVGNTPGCHAQFYYWVDSTNCNVHFVNQSIGATSYQWHIFNGVSTSSSTLANPVVTFTGNGYASLETRDSTGQVCDSVSYSIYTGAGCDPILLNCHAQFILIDDSVNTHTYYAYNQSTGSGLSYFWDFGDGSTSTLQYPTHTYASAGNYSVCLTISNGTGCSDTYCNSNNVLKISATHLMQTLIVKQGSGVPTGIEALQNSMQLALYPNPANSNITITANDDITSVKITDISGKTVISELNPGNRKQSIDISRLDNGTYFVELSAKNGGKATKKFVKIAQ